jgi:hypothetical protein
VPLIRIKDKYQITVPVELSDRGSEEEQNDINANLAI